MGSKSKVHSTGSIVNNEDEAAGAVVNDKEALLSTAGVKVNNKVPATAADIIFSKVPDVGIFKSIDPAAGADIKEDKSTADSLQVLDTNGPESKSQVTA